jgi:hypothetical protein
MWQKKVEQGQSKDEDEMVKKNCKLTFSFSLALA